jgi:tetratricopeptide (TPR) repeat protein
MIRCLHLRDCFRTITLGLLLTAAGPAWAAELTPEQKQVLGHLEIAQSFADMEHFRGTAIAQYEKALELSRTAFGPNHLMTSDIMAFLGSLYVKTGQYDKAEPLVAGSLKIREPQVGKDHIAIADNLCDLAEVEGSRGQYRKAEAYLLRALNIRTKKDGPKQIEVADVCERLGRLYRNMGLYGKSEPYYLRSLQLWEKQSPDGRRTADVLLGLGKLYKFMAQYDKAEALYRKALKIRENDFDGKRSLDYALLLYNLAEVHDLTSRFPEAEKLAKEALAIRKARAGEDSYVVGSSLHQLGLLYMRLGRYDEAIQHLKQAIVLTEKKGRADDLDMAATVGVLGAVYDDMGQFAEAEKLYRQALAIKERKLGRDHHDLGFELSNLASLYSKLGRFTDAEPLLLRSLDLRERALDPDHPDTATSRNNLGVLYLKTGQYEKAERMFRQVLQSLRKTRGDDNPATTVALNNLATVYDHLGQSDKARELLEASLKLRQQKLGLEHRDVAIALNNLGGNHNAAGRYAEAEPLFRRSIAMLEKIHGPKYHELALPLNNLALLLMWTGRGEEAEALFRRAADILEAVAPDHPTLAMPAANLASLYAVQKRWQDAADQTERSLRIVRRHSSRILPTLPEQEQLSFLRNEHDKTYHSALSLGLLRSGDEAVATRSASWVVNGKAIAHQALAERALLARDSKDPNVGLAVQELIALRKQLASLTFAKPPADRVEEYRRRIEQISAREQQLAKFVGLAGGRGQGRTWVDLDDVRKGLPRGSVLIDVARFPVFHFLAKANEKTWQPARYVAWVVPADEKSAVRLIDLGEADKIEAAVEAVRKPLKEVIQKIRQDGEPEAEKEYRKALSDLARLLLQPLLPHVGKAERWVLSPDASLWLVPWAALPLDDTTYVIEKHRLSYVTSGRDVVAGPARIKTNPAVIVANPDYDLVPGGGRDAKPDTKGGPAPDTRSADLDLPAVPLLPGTAAEAQAILPNVERYTGRPVQVYQEERALEATVKELRSPRVLGISTHGFFLPDQEVAPTERPNAEAAESVRTRDGKKVENPLLRCGLLLAGCNQRAKARPGVDEDGVLTGLEIVGLDLRGTELVVLSACETALGKVRNGEGVAGLRQAFQLAGAQSVIATLWLISDSATARLMEVFYDQLARGRSRDDALHTAQLFLIQSRRNRLGAAHPYFWAAFTLTGRSDDFRPVPEKQDPLENAEAYYQRGRKHEQEQQFDLALADYTEALRLDPKLARAWSDRGWLHYRKGLLDQAVTDYDEAIRLEPQRASAWSERGYIHSRRQDYDKALDDLNRAIEMDGKSFLAYLSRGDTYRAKKEHDKAAADYTEALRIKADSAATHNARGLAHAARDRLDDAIADYTEAIRLDPKHVWAYSNRARAYEQRKELDKAIADYTAALQLTPTDPALFNSRGLLFAKKGDNDQAVADYGAALRVDPKYKYALGNRGQAYKQKRAYDKALADFTEALRIDPKYVWAYNQRGLVHEAREEYEQAIADYTEALRLDPQAYWVANNRGLAHAARGEYDKAIADYSAALRIVPKYQWTYGVRGSALAELKRWEEADADFLRAIELKADDRRAWSNHALLRLQAGDAAGYRKVCKEMLDRFGQTEDPALANTVAWSCVLLPDAVAEPEQPLQLITRAVTREPKSYFYVSTLGSALYRKGKFEDAIERLKEAMALHGKGGGAEDWLFLAMTYHRLGKTEEARRWLDKAIQAVDQAGEATTRGGAKTVSWSRRLELGILRREAEAVAGETKRPAP